MHPPLLARCRALGEGGRLIKETELCFGFRCHGPYMVRAPALTKVERRQRHSTPGSPPIIGDVRDHALLEGNLLNLARHVAQVHQVAVDLGHPGFWSIMLGSVHSGSKAERGFRVSAMACALAPPVTSFLPRQPSAG